MRPGERHGDFDLSDLSGFDTIIDVRSPAEFAEDALPGSVNHPVLDDAQRHEIGTLYKQVSPFAARRLGAAWVAQNIARHIETAFADRPREWRPLVLCWRGGNRSGAMTHVLRAVGWDAFQLPGGYKRWRAHVMARLEALAPQPHYRIVCGPTGSGKSHLLQALARAGAQVLDLEALAAHRGSVLGGLPDQAQPGQRRFESLIMQALARFDMRKPVFVEAESRRIGSVHIPEALMVALRASPCLRIEAGEAARVALLLEDYRHFFSDLPLLAALLGRLKELHGQARIEHWMALAQEGAFPALVENLLRTHYDPLYFRSSRNNYAGLATARAFDGGALLSADFDRLAQAILVEAEQELASTLSAHGSDVPPVAVHLPHAADMERHDC